MHRMHLALPPERLIARLAPHLLLAVQQMMMGRYTRSSASFIRDAAYALAYLEEEMDLVEDSLPDGLKDDCRVIVSVTEKWKQRIGDFRLW